MQVEFGGNERFELKRRLGEGGMGVVFSARDRQRGQDVALKVLSRMSPSSILRFKREFRALSDIAHENLVSLYELLFSDGHWFFTMELLAGTNLDEHVLSPAQPSANALASTAPFSGTTPSIPSLDSQTLSVTQVEAGGLTPEPITGALGIGPRVQDIDALRPLLCQLAQGLRVLHAADRLHCDVKPSNVMVSDGRVVLLDFGLITAAYKGRRPANGIYGTPAYMPPEQIDGSHLTPAADWFSFGVVLYQLITGIYPRTPRWMYDYAYLGRYPRVTPPAATRPDTPTDLDTLCSALLDRDPAKRPGDADVLRVLESRRHAPRVRLLPARTPPADALIGRAGHMNGLRQALDDVHQRSTRVVYVAGAPGMGKTALVKHFLATLRPGPDLVVLTGRCYQRESVPYKTLDSLIDTLSVYLSGLGAAELDEVVPRDARLLSRLFPVLSQVRGFAGDHDAPIGLSALRRRASVALVTLMTSIAARRRLILFIDDIQWGETDSLPFLDALMRQIDAPMLMILAYRSTEAERSPLMRALRLCELGANSPPQRVVVEALTVEQAELQADRLIVAMGGDRSLAPRLARESAGDPLFLQALVRYALAHPEQVDNSVSLADVLARQLDELGAGERRLIDILAVAAQPLPDDLIQRAAELDAEACAAAIKRLEAERLVAIRESAGTRWFEPYHDRVREYVAGTLTPDVWAQYNRCLAAAAAASEERDPQILAEYYRATGDRKSAARYAILAAERAAHAHSFGRAAELLTVAIDSGQHDRHERRGLLVKLGTMRKAAGDGEGAAEAFLSASQLSDGAEAEELRRLSASQLLRSGHLDAGLAAIAPLMKRARLRMPEHAVEAAAQLLYLRARLQVRGLALAKPKVDVAHRRLRASICLDLAAGFVTSTPLLSAVFTVRGLLDALAVGDRRVAMHLGHHVCLNNASLGDYRGADKLAEFVASHTDRQSPAEVAIVACTRAFVSLLSGRFSEAHALCEQTLDVVDTPYSDPEFASFPRMREMLTVCSSIALLYRLDLAGMRSAFPAHLTESIQTGNRHSHVVVRIIGGAVLHGLSGDIDGIYRHTREALECWEQDGVQLPHFLAALALIWGDLASREPSRALARIREHTGPFRRGLIFQAVLMRITWCFFRGITLAAVAREQPARAMSLLTQAKLDWWRLSQRKEPWVSGLTALLAANIACARGQQRRVIPALTEAAASFEASDMPVWSVLCRWVLGHVMGGSGGEALRAEAERALAADGYPRFEILGHVLAPAFRV